MSKPKGEWVLSEIKRLRSAGEDHEIASVYAAAMQVEDSDHRSLVDTSIVFREMGKYQYADDICYKILEEDSNYSFAHFEFAISCIHQGRTVDALLSLDRLLAHRPTELRALTLAAPLAAVIGNGNYASSLLNRAVEIDPNYPDIAWMREFCRFATSYPYLSAMHGCLGFEQNRQRYLSIDRVSDQILAAIQEKRGFSLVRLGDGEGAFCRISDEDEDAYSNLYKRNREDRAQVWFDGEIDLHKSGFTQQAFQLRDVIRSADIVGLPYADWFTHEYKIASPVSISSIVNVIRMMQLPDLDTGQFWARQTCHVELQRSGRLAPIIQSVERIGLITSQPRAVEALISRFAGLDVEYISIPGEKLTFRGLSITSEPGMHFPDRFNEVKALLSRPLDGKLFLVAGGLLGKFYCDIIKAHGGVAVDVGSLVDAWSGFDTRPGFLNAGDRLT